MQESSFYACYCSSGKTTGTLLLKTYISRLQNNDMFLGFVEPEVVDCFSFGSGIGQDREQTQKCKTW